MAKIVSFKTACQLAKKFKKEDKRVIFTSGCFDILHIGHIEFFNKVRRWGGLNSIFFVGVDTNEYVRLNKGEKQPFFDQNARVRMLSSLTQIDYVVTLKEKVLAGTSGPFLLRYRKLNPSVVVFGNTEPSILKMIREEAREAECKFKHLPHRAKLESTSRIAKILSDHFPS